MENAAMIQNNLYQHFPKCFTNSFPTGTSCNTMRDRSWNEEIGPITQNPHGIADIILDNSCFEKGVEGERKEKRSGRRLLPPVLPLIGSGAVFVYLESQMHITPLSFEN